MLAIFNYLKIKNRKNWLSLNNQILSIIMDNIIYILIATYIYIYIYIYIYLCLGLISYIYNINFIYIYISFVLGLVLI